MITSNANGECTAQFRGRDVKGVAVQLPEDVCGITLGRGSMRGGQIDMEAHFTKFTLWEHDQPPSTEHISEYFNWFEVARTVCDITFPPHLCNCI